MDEINKTPTKKDIDDLAMSATGGNSSPSEGKTRKSKFGFLKGMGDTLEKLNKSIEDYHKDPVDFDVSKKIAEQFKNRVRKLNEDAQKIYAEYENVDIDTEKDEKKVMVKKFIPQIKESMKRIETIKGLLEIAVAIKNYEQKVHSNTNTANGEESTLDRFFSAVLGKPQRIKHNGNHAADSGKVTSDETKQAQNNGNEPSQNTEPGTSQPSVDPHDTGNTASGNNTLKANADPVPASEGNMNESSRTNNGRE